MPHKVKKKLFFEKKTKKKTISLVSSFKIDIFEKKPKNLNKEQRFILKQRLGVGGMCEVYKALDLRRTDWGDSQPYVALKKLLPEFKDNHQAKSALTQEFAKIRALSHNGIVKVYDIHLYEDDICLSMELLEGHTVYDYIVRHQLNDNNKNIKIIVSFLKALLHIHDNGLVHADIKPGNIFLSSGRTVIFDFNISTVVPKAGQQAAASPIQSLINKRSLPGYTKVYAGIERLRGEAPSQADDVFAAACVIYELLSGEHPYKRLSLIEAYEQEKKIKRLKSLTFRQWNYLAKGLHFNPEKRPTARELYKVFSKPNFLTKFW